MVIRSNILKYGKAHISAADKNHSPCVQLISRDNQNDISGIKVLLHFPDNLTDDIYEGHRNIKIKDYRKAWLNLATIDMVFTLSQFMPNKSKNTSAGFFVCITIDAEQLYCPRIRRAIILLKKNTPVHNRVIIEVKESTLHDYDDELVDIINGLSNKNIEFILDGFCKGLSSLTYLEHARFDSLIIDPPLTMIYGDHLVNPELVRSIVAFCHCLGVKTIATSDSDAQYYLLKNAGVSCIQRNLLKEPISGYSFFNDKSI